MTYIKTPFPIGKMGKWENGKNVIKTFQTAIHSPTNRLRQTSHLCSCKSYKYYDMRHGKCGLQRKDKRKREKEGKESQESQESQSLTVSYNQ